jgi:hypothetical protein
MSEISWRVLAQADAAQRTRLRAMSSAMSELSAADTLLRQDIVLEGQGEEGSDIRLRGVTDPREDLMEIRESIVTAIESNSQADIAEALSMLPNDKAAKIEAILLGLQQEKERAAGFRAESEDIGAELARLAREESIAGARAGEQAGALSSLRALEGDLLQELATFEQLGD